MSVPSWQLKGHASLTGCENPQVYNVPGHREVRDGASLKPLLAKVSVPRFEPRSDVRIQTEEKATEEDRQSESEWVDQVCAFRGSIRCSAVVPLYLL